MLRYIGMAWNRTVESDDRTAAHVRGRLTRIHSAWLPVLDVPGLLVLCQAPEDRRDGAIIRVGERGVILGSLFRRHPLSAAARLSALDEREVQAVERTHGRSLVETHWGSYVLMLRDGENGQVDVLRGPLSSLPCYYLSYEHVHLLHSVADDCVALDLLRYSINWGRIRAQVAGGDYLNGETGLNEVGALDAGACLSLRGPDRRLHAYWTPGSAYREVGIVEFRDAARELRRVAFACIGSWAEAHASIALKLSGGLDSSIVLAGLAAAPTRPRIVCVNFHSQLLGDERIFARSMAGRIGVRLIERERAPDLDLRVVLRCNRTVSPVLHLTGFDSEPATIELARDNRATAIFNGELGDDLFGNALRQEVLVEFIQRYGIRPSLIRVAVEYGLRHRMSVWRALRLAMRDAAPRPLAAARAARRSAHGSSPALHASRLASADALNASAAEAARFVHPWSRELARLPAGKRQLVFAMQIVSSTSYESPFSSIHDPPAISPLASQPLVEFALGIPTHLHIHGGQNRALARAAFSRDLSDVVLYRGRGKGSPDLWLRALVAHNRPFLRELFLDGVLVREGLLDRRKVERVLSETLYKDTASLTDLIAQMYIEAWARRWSAPSHCAAPEPQCTPRRTQ